MRHLHLRAVVQLPGEPPSVTDLISEKSDVALQNRVCPQFGLCVVKVRNSSVFPLNDILGNFLVVSG